MIPVKTLSERFGLNENDKMAVMSIIRASFNEGYAKGYAKGRYVESNTKQKEKENVYEA